MNLYVIVSCFVLVFLFLDGFERGKSFYENQILMLVFMWKHDKEFRVYPDERAKFFGPITVWKWAILAGPIYIWYDSQWTRHGFIGAARFFFFRLTHNTKNFKSPMVKLNVVRINARHMFKEWLYGNGIFRFIHSLYAFLRLSRRGFRITRSGTLDGYAEINRFWWGNKQIEDMADIDRFGKRYITMFDGTSKRLYLDEERNDI